MIECTFRSAKPERQDKDTHDPCNSSLYEDSAYYAVCNVACREGNVRLSCLINHVQLATYNYSLRVTFFATESAYQDLVSPPIYNTYETPVSKFL